MHKLLTNTWAKLSIATVGLMSLPATRALAETYDYNYDYGSSTTSNAAGAGLAIGLLVFFSIIAIVALAFFVFWIMMLVDAIKRTNWASESDKTTWILVLVLGFALGFGWLAAILYYFLIKKKLNGGKKAKK